MNTSGKWWAMPVKGYFSSSDRAVRTRQAKNMKNKKL